MGFPKSKTQSEGANHLVWCKLYLYPPGYGSLDLLVSK